MNKITFTDHRDTLLWTVGDAFPGSNGDEIVTRVDREHGEVHFRRATWWRRAWYCARARLLGLWARPRAQSAPWPR